MIITKLSLKSLLLPFLMTPCLATAQSADAKIRAASSQLAEALYAEATSEVVFFFDKDSRLLPEYHPTLKGSTLIESYYHDLFKKTETIAFKRAPFQIEKLGPLFLEMGLFEHDYNTEEIQKVTYHGKYMTYWSMQSGVPKVVAHIWGSSSWFDAHTVDLTYIHTSFNPSITPLTDWEKEIEASRQFAYKAVFEGDAETQLIGYDEEAIYMTYYDPPFIGKQAISDYFMSHYNPEIPKDSLNTRIVDIMELGNYALKFGEYFVAWTYENQPFLIHGKGITLFKRTSEGKIKIFRQMINHSMPPMPTALFDQYQASRITRHLDNQQLALEDYLAVYSEKTQILPPGKSAISGIEAFKSHLEQQRASGTLDIKHEVESVETYPQTVLLQGSSTGAFFATGSSEGFPFSTKNLMVLDRDEMGQLQISTLIWNMNP